MANNKVQLSDGTVLLDLTGDTVTPETLMAGVIAHNAAGERISGAVAPVRYDVAQNLTSEQQKQARGNIGAAPDGFGLGGNSKLLTSDDDVNTIGASGWYSWVSNSAPANALVISYITIMRVDAYNSGVKVQTLYGATDGGEFITQPIIARRMIYGSKIGAWEYVNPRMYLGVEYRTTERYNGQPVYCKLVNFGALPNATQKVVKHNIPNVSSVISVYGSAQDQAIGVGAFGAQVTGINADNTNVAIWTSADLSNYSAYVAIKYTKTTD